jgi:large subunit ribosomal protein L22
MEAIAKARYLRGSARKMRLVANIVRGENVVWAADRLKFMPQRAAFNLRKILNAATANAQASEGTAKLKAEDLRISRLTVDSGPIARRFRPVCMGRAYRIRKRYCHVTLVVTDEQEQSTNKKKKRARGK